MSVDVRRSEVVRVGDVAGKGRVYLDTGALILAADEHLLRTTDNWDIDLISPWRRTMPNILFAGLNGKARSRLYITDRRIVLVREIDSWREVKGDMTPLGMANAVAKKAQLDHLHASGVFQFCEIRPSALTLVASKKRGRPNSWLSMRLLSADGVRYALMIWKSDGKDEQTLSMIEAQFSR